MPNKDPVVPSPAVLLPTVVGLMDAKDAFATTQKIVTSDVKDEILTISKRIEEAIVNKQYSIEVTHLSDVAREELEKKNYRIDKKRRELDSVPPSDSDNAYFVISWAKS